MKAKSQRLSYQQAVEAVMGRGFGIRADLDRIRALGELLDHPELSYPTIHVAGTNGKTSTARIIASVLAAHGIKAGIYTSPHLQSIRERFSLVAAGDQGLGAEMIDEESFSEVLGYLLPFIELVEGKEREQVTYFELTTAMSFEWMAQIPVDVGVIEVGMGGTWDATNVVDPKVAVLTHIDVDHERFLGETARENAIEKAGIIKRGSNVVSSTQRNEVLEVIKSKSDEMEVSPMIEGRDFSILNDSPAVGGRLLTIKGLRGQYDDLLLPLYGSHQSRNAAVALAACELFLDRALDGASTRAGLAAVTSPGRLEVVKREPLVVLDGAHNPDGASVLGPALEESFGPRQRTFVVSITKGKDFQGIMKHFAPYGSRFILTRHKDFPSEEPEVVAASHALSGSDVKVLEDMSDALDIAISSALDDGMVVVTGSLYGVGEARDLLLGKVT